MDLFIGAFAHTEYLEPGDSSLRSQEIRIPQTLSGQYYIFVCADYEDTVDEGSWENNNCNHGASPIHILLFPPDLQVSSIAPTSTAWSEQSVWVKWTITNTGIGHTPDVPWMDKIYLSNDNLLNIDVDSLIGSRTHSQVLDVDSSYSDSVVFTFAKGSYGTRYLFAVADASDTIYESNQGNNILPQSFYIQLSPPPDLRVTQLSAPDTAFSRQVVTVQWVVANDGSGPTKVGSWKDRVYLSTDSSSNVSGDTVLYTFVYNGSLAVGGNYMQNRDITIPSNKNGLFYLKVFTDATDTVYEYMSENNNVTVAPIYLKIPGFGDLPDLVVSHFQAPAQITAGDTCTVRWTVTNIGRHPTSMSASYWLDAVYFSNDNILDINSDINAFQLDHSQNLKPDSSYTVTKTIVCPDGVSGQHYLFLATDFTNRVSEASDSNNSASVSANFNLFPPDLYVTSIAVQDSADCGQPINIGWTVINQGIGPTRVSKWYDGVYLSKDQILDSTDYMLGSLRHQSLLVKDSSYSGSITPTIPSGLAGPYYVMVKTDKNNNVYEHNNENNNYRRTPDAIQIILPPPVNLRVTNITIPDSCFPGEPVEITWTVANTETSDVKGQWTDAVYVSADTVWDYYDDPVIGTATLTGTLKAGASYTKSVAFDIGDFFPGNRNTNIPGNLEANLPGVVPGSYHVFVRTDILNNINETDESDNQNFSSDSIIVDVRDLAVGVPDSSTISTGQRKYYKITPGAGYDLKLCNDQIHIGHPRGRIGI
jgi:subtilase family serine protease